MLDLKNTGERINYIRKSMTKDNQEAFAYRFGLSQKAVSKIENNLQSPSAKLLKEISVEFDVSVEWLLTGQEDSNPLKVATPLEDDYYERLSELKNSADTKDELIALLKADNERLQNKIKELETWQITKKTA